MVTSGDDQAGTGVRGGGRPGLASLAVGAPAAAVRYARRVSATARNAAEVVRFGGLETGEQPSPFTVEAEQPNYRLRHYFADDVPADSTPILLVPPLMMATEVWDVSPATSAVASLHGEGVDTWVVDFGDPGHEPGGLERTLTDHVLAVSDAVDRVLAATGRAVVLGGYSQGGMFAYQAAAFRRGKGIDSLVTFGSPADTTAPLPIPISPDVAARLAAGLVASGVLGKVTLPRWATRLGFKLLSPAKTVQGRVQFLLALHDRDALLPRERQRRFLDSEGWTAYSGPAIAELLEQFVTHNRMLEGGFVIDDRLVTLADIEMPIMTVVGTTDTIGHPDSVRAIRRAAPRSDVYELTLPGGHFGLVVGSAASDRTWPAVAAWVRWRTGRGELPEDICPAELVESKPLRPGAGAAALAQATEFGIGASRIVLGLTRQAARAARGVVSEAPAQLPRLARLEQLDPATRISLGQLLDEQARRNPSEICFLFGDRAYRQRDVKHRVDSVVKGLISAGIRHGDRVGVLMTTRPSAFTVVAALSRLGATGVLLRPEGDLRREAELGHITWLISDPEHADGVDALDGVTWCVLGGGAKFRELNPNVLDLERIDPDDVELPAWYRANPHRAGDIAFVLFTGEGDGIRAVQITNRRWALSALGTASAAALKPGDTVYSTTPHHHSSALLMSVGGAVAGGARFAMASSDDPDTFWEEVRRYGATHVSYTWTSLHAVTVGPPNRNEQHHPIRMFLGSGMPRNLWRRVTERFPTARVLEFYASAEGEAILANLTGTPIGSMGRPIPGTADVRVAAYDRAALSLELGPDGLARECEPDEVGLLLARVNPTESILDEPLRGVFEPGDAWRSTGDLFLRDVHGDLWLVDPVTALIPTERGPIMPAGARLALGTIPAVDLMVIYGVPEGGAQVVVAAVTLCPGAELTSSELDRAFGRLPASYRPKYVQVVRSIPVTTWHRPMWRPLQKAGLPKPTSSRKVFRLGADRQHYEQL
ncbi:MAG: putative long chain acyl-CoA synthase [Pseudonocardiales bacterium]|nr:putative long chain acyl-CoA synthase [Pseudonocardiales bacterium]